LYFGFIPEFNPIQDIDCLSVDKSAGKIDEPSELIYRVSVPDFEFNGAPTAISHRVIFSMWLDSSFGVTCLTAVFETLGFFGICVL
jgi:hypothetical protein